MQDIRQEACYNSETEKIFIPFKDSNLLYNDLFQECVKKMFYRNFSDARLYKDKNQIDKKENFWGPPRMDVSVAYQDKNADAEKTQLQTDHLNLSPEQVKSCSESDKLPSTMNTMNRTALIISCTLGALFIIISLIIFFIRQRKSKKPKTGVDTNPEYGADYYYKQNEETYGGTVQYIE